MRRSNDSNGTRIGKMFGLVALAGAGVFLLTQLGSLRRYLGMMRMSARRHPQPPGTLRQGDEAPPRWGTSHWPMH